MRRIVAEDFFCDIGNSQCLRKQKEPELLPAPYCSKTNQYASLQMNLILIRRISSSV